MRVFKVPVRAAQSTSDMDATQNTGLLRKLFVEAKPSKPELTRLTVLTARTRGEGILPVRFKTYERAREKGLTEQAGHFERLLDLAASTVVFPNLQALYAGACALISAADVVRLRDRFENPRANGYSDMIVNLRMTNGHIVEMQLHVQPMLTAKRFEQVLYSRRRVLEAKDPAKYASVIRTLHDTATEIYGIARIALEQNRRLTVAEELEMTDLTQHALNVVEGAFSQV